MRAAALDFRPPTDDRPYLIFFARTPGEILHLLRPYFVLLLLTVVVLAAIFVADKPKPGAAGRRSTALAALYGGGFVLIERCYQLSGVSSPILRVVCVLALVAPIGLCLGTPFPDLLRIHGRSDERRIAHLWAVNGVGSVLGGALTLVLLPTLGGHVVLLAACAVYLLAWVVDRRQSVPSA